MKWRKVIAVVGVMGVVCCTLGYWGLSWAEGRYPDQFLGGWAFIFAPIYWLSFPLLVLALLGGIGVGIKRVLQKCGQDKE